MDIYVSCITFDNQLLKEAYGYDASGSDSEIAQILTDHGLFSEQAQLRTQFKEAIEFLCYNVRTGNLPESPATFFLKLLLSKIEKSKVIKNSRTPQYFELLIKLTEYYFKLQTLQNEDIVEIFEPTELVKGLISQLDLYQS